MSRAKTRVVDGKRVEISPAEAATIEKEWAEWAPPPRKPTLEERIAALEAKEANRA